MNVKKQKEIFKKTIRAIPALKQTNTWNEALAELSSIEQGLTFIGQSNNPMDRRIETAALFLAVIKVMQRHQYDFETIRQTALTLANELVRPPTTFQLMIKRMTARVATTTLVQQWLRKKMENTRVPPNTEGFVVRYVPSDNKNFLFGIDIIECGICKLFNKHDATSYSRILCEVDYITTKLAGLDLHRTGTIANGSLICDFRFAKTKKIRR